VGGLIKHYQDEHGTLRGAGVVVGSLIDPKTIGNDHIRIHAMEGKLFREVVIDAAERKGLKCPVHREQDLYEQAAKKLKTTEPALRKKLIDLGRDVDGGWRGEQKAAALAAWLLLKR
jgi:hypothetical protein